MYQAFTQINNELVQTGTDSRPIKKPTFSSAVPLIKGYAYLLSTSNSMKIPMIRNIAASIEMLPSE
ncbi:Uncharacterised protein [uncultured archaeon]|nr:Uncharacterised protein [uncultured archaeon]